MRNNMNNFKKKRGIIGMILSSFIITCTTTYSFPLLNNQTPGSTQDNELSQNTKAEDDIFPPIVQLDCPKNDTSAILYFNHHSTSSKNGVDYEISVVGEYKINIVNTGKLSKQGDNKGIYNIDKNPISVKLLAKGIKKPSTGETCPDFHGSTNMRADIGGSCDAGQLTLNIVEYYEDPGTVTRICGNDDIPITIPFMIKAKNSETWDLSIMQLSGDDQEKNFKMEDAWLGGDLNLNYKLSMSKNNYEIIQ
jgi:hypothetical protein